MNRWHERLHSGIAVAISFLFSLGALADDKNTSELPETRTLRQVELRRTRSFYLVVWGSHVSTVDVQALRSVRPTRVDIRFSRYEDWVPDRYDRTEVHVFWTMTPKELLGDDTDPVDLSVTPRRKDGTAVGTLQIATAFNEKTFLGRLHKKAVGRDMLSVVPIRFHPQRAERTLINFYSEDSCCGQLEIRRGNGSRVQEVSHEWAHYTKLPRIVPWDHKKGNNPPGRYQARMRIVNGATCEDLKENAQSDYVVYSFFDILR